jgi:sulfite exporter TauE/SafE
LEARAVNSSRFGAGVGLVGAKVRNQLQFKAVPAMIPGVIVIRITFLALLKLHIALPT